MQVGTLSTPFWCLCQKLSLSPLYFNKTLLHKSSERSSLVSGPGLNSSPLESKNPASLCDSATTFQRFFKKLKIEFIYDPAILLLDIYPEKITKMNTKWIKDLNTKTKTLKFLEESVNLHDHELSNSFLYTTPKTNWLIN